LKGLFSVATTSTKPPGVIKADIRRVLGRMQIQYRETKTGFECIHMPSIDVSSLTPSNQLQSFGSVDTGRGTLTHKQSIVKKASKLSFGMKRDKGKDKELPLTEKEKEKDMPSRPSVGTTLTATPSSGSSSFFNVSSNHTVVGSDQPVTTTTTTNGASNGASVDIDIRPPSRPSTAAGKSKMLPPIPRELQQQRPPSPKLSVSPPATGDIDPFDNIVDNRLGVRFEINIVKVQWLPLNGIQFRRTSGDGWQYQMLARRVLTELKL